MPKIVFFAMAIIGGSFLMVESGIFDALLSFWLSGGIPGTDLTISPNLMIAGLIATAWLVLFRMTALGTMNAMLVKRLAARQTRRQRMPKKRYTAIES